MTIAGNAPAAMLKTRIEIISGKPAAVPATAKPRPIISELMMSSALCFLSLSQAYPNTGVETMPKMTKLLESMLAETGVKPLNVLNEEGAHVKNPQATMLYSIHTRLTLRTAELKTPLIFKPVGTWVCFSVPSLTVNRKMNAVARLAMAQMKNGACQPKVAARVGTVKNAMVAPRGLPMA